MMYNHARSPYSLKVQTIKNCIFAADIEPSAVDIAQLRLWLSLVIDDEINPEAQSPLDGHRNPIPLPNLECNIVCGNSLIDEFEGTPLINSSELIATAQGNQQRNVFTSTYEAILPSLLEAQNELFGCEDTEKKQELKETIESLKDELVKVQMEDATPAKWKRYQDARRQASRPFVLWQIDFARVFREKGGFDVVIGNPPYVSAATQQLSKEMLKNREIIVNCHKYKTLYSKWDLYIPFMELGLQMVHRDGVFSMIVPYPLTNQIYAKKMREMIIREYNLIEMVDLKDTKVFDATVQNCIPIILKADPLGKTIISGYENGTIRHRFVQGFDKLIQDVSSLIWNLTQENRAANKYLGMNVLGDYCYISKGMVLNADEKTAKGAFKKSDLISNQKDEKHPKKYIEGKDIDRFIIKRERYLEWGTERSPVALSRPTFEELYTSPKLLFNCLGELKVSIDMVGEYYCEQAIRVAVPWYLLSEISNKSILGVIKKYSTYSRKELELISKKVDMLYLLGIMNSQTGKNLLADLRGGDYHIVPEHIRNIPVPLVEKKQQDVISKIVKNIIKIVDQDGFGDRYKDLQKELDNEVKELYEKWGDENA